MNKEAIKDITGFGLGHDASELKELSSVYERSNPPLYSYLLMLAERIEYRAKEINKLLDE